MGRESSDNLLECVCGYTQFPGKRSKQLEYRICREVSKKYNEQRVFNRSLSLTHLIDSSCCVSISFVFSNATLMNADIGGWVRVNRADDAYSSSSFMI